jgi:hypothetical protein
VRLNLKPYNETEAEPLDEICKMIDCFSLRSNETLLPFESWKPSKASRLAIVKFGYMRVMTQKKKWTNKVEARYLSDDRAKARQQRSSYSEELLHRL